MSFTPWVTRAIAKSMPAPLTCAQSIVPCHLDTSIPVARAPPTAPLGSGRAATGVGVGVGVGPGVGVGFVPDVIGVVLLVTGADVEAAPPPEEPPQPATRRDRTRNEIELW